jgi:hypothetical protein
MPRWRSFGRWRAAGVAGSSLAQTAKLIASLTLEDHLSGPARGAESAVTGLEKSTDHATSRVGLLERGLGRARTGLGHFGSQLKSIVTGPLGFLGLGAGLAGIGGIFSNAIHDATELGDAVEKLQGITGDTASNLSGLLDVLGKFGVGSEQATKLIGFTEKAVGNLTATRKSAQAFEKQYGLQLLDSSGKARDFNSILLDAADIYAHSKNRAEAAAFATKLFGRSYQDLIPLLRQGRAGIQSELDSSLRISDSDVKNLEAYKSAQRELGDTLGDISTKIGLKLIPEITGIAKAFSDWLDSGGDEQVLSFFDQLIEGGKEIGRFVGGSVIPTLKGLGGAAVTFWNAIPGPLRDLLVKGFVADRTVKFLFGFSLADVGKNLLGGVLGGLGERLFQRGSSPANALYVKDVAGGLGGGPGGALGGSGFASKLVTAVSLVSIVGDALAVYQALQGFLETTAAAQKDLAAKADEGSKQSGAEALGNLANLTKSLDSLQGLDRILADTFGSKESGTALVNLSHAIANDGKLSRAQLTTGLERLKAAQATAISHGWTDAANSIGADIDKVNATLASNAPPTAAEIGAAVAGAKDPQISQLQEKLSSMWTPHTLATAVVAGVKASDAAKTPYAEGGTQREPGGRPGNHALALDASRHIQELVDSERAVRRAVATADTHSSSNLSRLGRTLSSRIDSGLEGVAASLDRIFGAISRADDLLSTIASNPPQLSAYTTVNVSTSVSTRDVSTRTNASSRYGKTAIPV